MHLKAILRRIDQGHPAAEMGPMAFTTLQNQINPGMNHLVTKGALRCLLRQRLEHRLGEHDFAPPTRCYRWTATVEASCARHTAIAPSNGRQRPACPCKFSIEMFPVKAME